MFIKHTTLSQLQYYSDNLEHFKIEYGATVDEWGKYTIYVYDKNDKQKEQIKKILKHNFNYLED